MTDHDLLKLAALAAGYDIKWDPTWLGVGSLMIRAIPNPGPPFSDWLCWRPLEDDGDAFRLALRLGIEWRRASKSRSIGRVVKVWFSHDGNPRRAASMCISEQVNGCTIAATRRAIVRAAAEIGRRISKE